MLKRPIISARIGHPHSRGHARGGRASRACTHKSPSQVRFRANRTLSRHRRMTESVQGSGCRPSRTMPRAPGPASGSLQGRNPREVERWRCRDRYGYLGSWSGAVEVVIAPAGLVFGKRRPRNRSRWCGSELLRAARPLRRRRIANGSPRPAGDQLDASSFRCASTTIVMTYRSGLMAGAARLCAEASGRDGRPR